METSDGTPNGGGGPCCAHMRVHYTPTYERPGLVVASQWICQDCGDLFVPAAERDRLRGEVESLRYGVQSALAANIDAQERARIDRACYEGQCDRDDDLEKAIATLRAANARLSALAGLADSHMQLLSGCPAGTMTGPEADFVSRYASITKEGQ